MLIIRIGPISNTPFLSEFNRRKLLDIQYFISSTHTVNFDNFEILSGRDKIYN